MFGKKKAGKAAPKQDSTQQNQGKEAAPRRKKEKPSKKNKKKNGLSQVFRESVFETVLEDFRSNTQFVQKKDGKVLYIGLVLDTATIGGMDKKSARNDEAKGTIIEKINSGKIKTYITAECMDEGLIVIIPEPLTLSEMDEFSLLTGASYEFCAVDGNGDIETLDIHTTYPDVCDIVMNDGHVDDVLGGDLEGFSGGMEEEIDLGSDVPGEPSGSDTDSDGFQMAEEPEPEYEDIPFDDDDVDSLDDLADGEDLEEIPDEPAQGPDLSWQEDEAGRSVPQDDPPVQAGTGYGVPVEEEPPAQEEEVDMDPQVTNDALVRKFYSDDLGLEVTTEPFDAQFMVGNAFIPFDENRPEGWLNEQLNEMSRDANMELAKLHEQNLFLMRERYFKLLSMQCDRIHKDLDIHDENTQYGQLYLQIQEEREANFMDMEHAVGRKKQELESMWQEKLQKVGMDAARAAQHEYREKYMGVHEKKLYAIEETVKSNFNADFEDRRKEILDRRRMEASTLLDLAITETLSEVSDLYLNCIEDEKVRYQELRENMRMFRDELIQEDIARVRVAEEEQRQAEKADQVLAEQTVKIRALTEDFNQRKQSMQLELKKLREDNKARLEETQRDAEKQVERMQRERDDTDKRFNELLDNYKNLEETVRKKYAAQIDELKDELNGSKLQNEQLIAVHKRNGTIGFFLMMAAVLAALAIGFIGGEYTNSSRQVKMYQQTMLSEESQNNAEVSK